MESSAMRKILFLVIVVHLFSLPVHGEELGVAKVNGVVISVKDVEEVVARLIPRASFHGGISDEKRNELRKKAVDDLISRELQYQDALARGLKPDTKLINERMALIRKKFASRKDYKKALKDAGITESELRKRAARAVLIEKNIRKTTAEPARMSDEALRDYYDKNIAKFRKPESVRLRIISSKDEKKARRALSELKAGKDFGSVAARMSEDNYRIKGGDIGYIHRGRIQPELEDAAFNLAAGEISGIIKSDGTWFIVKVEDRQLEYQLSFEESSGKLKKELESKRAAELMEKWMAKLRASAKIEINENQDPYGEKVLKNK